MNESHENLELGYRLRQVQNALREMLIRELKLNWAPATEAAKIMLDEWDARLLVETHRRISYNDLGCISASLEPTHHLMAAPRIGAYSDILAAELGEILSLDFCDSVLPRIRLCPENHQAAALIPRLLCLDRAESIGLRIIMEGASLTYIGTLNYENWWTPAILLRLLQNPELDRLPWHREPPF